MPDETPCKHVIFLGAGASASSGYPQADKLRLRLSTFGHFTEFVRSCIGTVDGAGHLFALAKDQVWSHAAQAIDVFRHGGFATVDEFCRLAAGSKDKKILAAVDGMRFMTRFVIGLHNPEEKFEASEYYGFVQRLFDESLHRLRSDVVVLSFNYDPYLDYLLLRAQERRSGMVGRAFEPYERNALCGGFHDIGSWAERGATRGGFALLKLHGSIAQATEHNRIFEKSVSERLPSLMDTSLSPFILFPWELFDEKGAPASAAAFPKIGYNDWGHQAFTATWVRAKRAVYEAEKLSFVGISMHQFLDQGFRWLFDGRVDQPRRIVVANPDIKSDQDDVANSFTRTMDMLKRVAPKMMSPQSPHGLRTTTYKVGKRANFAEFIEHEMG